MPTVYVVCKSIKDPRFLGEPQTGPEPVWTSLPKALKFTDALRAWKSAPNDSFPMPLAAAMELMDVSNKLYVHRFVEGLRTRLMEAERFDITQHRPIEPTYNPESAKDFGRPTGMMQSGPSTVSISIHDPGIGKPLPDPTCPHGIVNGDVPDGAAACSVCAQQGAARE